MGLYDEQEDERERGLTSSRKKNIKNAVGECEIKGCHEPPHDVHHINEDRTDDSYKNLIVLCANHHNDAHGKNREHEKTPRQLLYGIVKRRAAHKEKRIKEILRKPKPEKDPVPFRFI